jgi:nitroreductase
MTHRKSVIAGGIATVTLAAVGYRLWDRGALALGEGPPYEPWDEWQGHEREGQRRPLHAAVLAASPHNTQPWLFEVSDTNVAVHADRARHLGAFDPFRREMHLGIGCAIENLVLAARAFGIDSIVEPALGRLEPSPGVEPVLAARIALDRSGPTESSLFAAIPQRRTDRGPYRDAPVAPDLLRMLGEVASGPDVRVVFLSDEGARHELGTVIVDATRRIVDDAEMSGDSYRWVRIGRRDILAHRDGITIETSGTTPLVTLAAKVLPDLDEAATHRSWLATTRDVHTETAAVFGMILVRDRLEMAPAIAAGRAWQRLHLAATAQGLAAQPLNQPVEMMDRSQTRARSDAYGPALARLASAGDWEPTFVFRLGHPTRRPLHSPRRALDDVIRV